MNEETKESLLAQIEKLISYGKEEPTINPSLLEYLSIEDLTAVRNSLIDKVGKLSDEDRSWLEQFKKYD